VFHAALTPANSRPAATSLALCIALLFAACTEQPTTSSTAPAPPPPPQPTTPTGPNIASADDHRALAAWPAPVLLPSTANLRRAAFLTAGPSWYTAAINRPGLTITIEANNRAFVRPEIQAEMAAAPPRSAPRIGRNEGIVQADFVIDGVAWAIGVECHDHHVDPRCTGEAFVRQVIAELTPWSVPILPGAAR